ncbi:hypothetical protein ACFVWR_09420 [Leifsonia sp. NPDC058292]|uniref:hypothetical protein n=1 Tax=Leifsonia sp. NPDC058292 TaxID=3346428 RepID=UPI0036D96C45
MRNNTTDRPSAKTGRKRVVIAAGALLGVAALATAAAFTDQAFLNLGGSGGFGGSENTYNIQVSNRQEATVASVASWIEANPDAADITPIVGADSLVPGGDPLLVNIPVRNESASFGSTLDIAFENIRAADPDPDQAARDAAYASLLRVDIAQVDDATSVPTQWAATGLTLADGSIAATDLAALDAGAGSVLVVRVYLVDGADQVSTNAANGGGVQLQATVSGSSVSS